MIKRNLIFLLILITFACQDKKSTSSKDKMIVDLDRDSVEYRLDVKNDYEKELFLMTRNIIAKDSCFGGLKKENINRAFIYLKNKNLNPFLRYTVFEKINNSLLKIWDIDEPNVDNILFPILESGVILLEKKDQDGKKYYIENYKLLRVVNKNSYSLNSMCLNFKFENSLWNIKSRENIITTPNMLNIGYCIDTTYLCINTGGKNVPKNRINFLSSFTSLESHWECNK